MLSRNAIRQRFRQAAPAHIVKALDFIDANPSSLQARLLALLTSTPLPLPLPLSLDSLLRTLTVANVPVTALSTATARRFLDAQDGVSTALDWTTRHIVQYGLPPPDIWRRVHSCARLPLHREQWYKLLFNAQPLGARIFHFAPEDLCCHACPPTP